MGPSSISHHQHSDWQLQPCMIYFQLCHLFLIGLFLMESFISILVKHICQCRSYKEGELSLENHLQSHSVFGLVCPHKLGQKQSFGQYFTSDSSRCFPFLHRWHRVLPLNSPGSKKEKKYRSYTCFDKSLLWPFARRTNRGFIWYREQLGFALVVQICNG